METEVWPIVQSAGAGGVAWYLAHVVLGHPRPFFAPIAAVVSLAATVGGRGERAVGMLVGVAIGVGAGQLLVFVLGKGLLQVAIIIAVAMLTTATFVQNTLSIVQAGASAALVITMHGSGMAVERLLDALIGGGVALLFSQILFAPNPLSFLTFAGRRALSSIAEGLRASARALADNDAAAAEAAVQRLRKSRGSLDALATARKTGQYAARRTLRGRLIKRCDFERLDARLGEVDLLFESALLLARATDRLFDEHVRTPAWLSEATAKLACGIEALAADLDTLDGIRRAYESARKAEQAVGSSLEPSVARVADHVRQTASDVLRIAGCEAPARKPKNDPSADNQRGG